MQSIMSNIFNLVENFVDISNSKYGLVIGVKHQSFNMNDAYAMSPYDIVGHPIKVIQPTTFFSNSKHLFV